MLTALNRTNIVLENAVNGLAAGHGQFSIEHPKFVLVKSNSIIVRLVLVISI